MTDLYLPHPDAHLDMQRRRLLRVAATGAATALVAPGLMASDPRSTILLPFDHGQRIVSEAYEGKGRMIVQRTRPPVLETPFDVFGGKLITSNTQHYVRWHLSRLPRIDTSTFRLGVRGNVYCPMSLSMEDLRTSFKAHEIVAVSQCAGNSRGFFAPRVPGSQWGHGAMANASWRGVRLGDVLRRAGVRGGSACVRFQGLDQPAMPATPVYRKSLAVDHALHDDVLLAYELNGEPLPHLNGFPLRLVVPGWYSTYWVKMLGDVEVLTSPDDSYWMAKAYRIEGNAVTRMSPRSFVTSLAPGSRLPSGTPLNVTGIAFGGDSDVAAVQWRLSDRTPWQAARITERTGRYGFCRWSATMHPAAGSHTLQVRARNRRGETQPAEARWNASGYGYNGIESVAYEGVA